MDVLRGLGIEIDLSKGDADQELASWIQDMKDARGGADDFAGSVNELEAEMIEAADKIGISKKELKGLIDETKEGREAAAFAKKYGLSMDAVKSKTKSAKQAVKGLTSTVKALAAAGVITALMSFGTGSAKLSAQYEQTQVAYEVMLGTAEEAKTVLEDLNEFSNVTPFEPDQVNEAGKTLLQFKVQAEELIPLMQKVGDVAAGTGKDYNSLAQMVGKAHALNKVDNEMLQQVPVLYGELAKSMGVTEQQIFQMASAGKIGFAELEGAMSSLTSEGGSFFGMMDKQSQTAIGLWSTMQGQMSNLNREIGNMILEAGKPLLEIMISLTSWIMKNKAALAVVKAGVLAITPVIGVLLVSSLYSAIAALNIFSLSSLKAMLPYIGIAAAIMAVILIIQDLYTWLNGGESVIGNFLGPFEEFKVRVINIFTEIIENVAQFFAGIKSAIGNAINGVLTFFKEKGKYLVMALFPISVVFFYRDEILGAFEILPDKIIGFFTTLPDKLLGVLGGLKDQAAGVLKDMVPDWAVNIVGKFGGEKIEGRATGGPVDADTPYVVGEKGPEVFVSKSAGTIIPNGGGRQPRPAPVGGTGGTGISLVVNFNAPVTKDDGDSLVQKIKAVLEDVMTGTVSQTRAKLGVSPA